jgi:hypothetical protein
MMNRFWIVLLLVLSLPFSLFFSWPVAAQEKNKVRVDLELILMADGSGSIEHAEFLLQRRGYARALRDRRVIDSIRFGPKGLIALAYVEWSGPDYQEPIVPWTVIRTKQDIDAFARRLEEHPREIFSGGTALGDAILYGVSSLETNGFSGDRRVIDLSADGSDKDGLDAVVGRAQAVARGITVNGLPIVGDWPGLATFFRDNVIGGPGAFYVPAYDFRDFEIAVRKKLIREIVDKSLTTTARR